MLDINAMNFVTVGLIAIAGYALLRFGLKMAGVQAPDWL